MRELSDRQLDDCIVHALDEGYVTAQQKQRAWERLQRSAAAQKMLPPLEDCSAEPTPMERLEGICARLLHNLKRFVLDETVYRRARQQYFWIELYAASSQSFTMQQRFAYGVFRS
jgi:hypothetical protein